MWSGTSICLTKLKTMRDARRSCHALGRGQRQRSGAAEVPVQPAQTLDGHPDSRRINDQLGGARVVMRLGDLREPTGLDRGLIRAVALVDRLAVDPARSHSSVNNRFQPTVIAGSRERIFAASATE